MFLEYTGKILSCLVLSMFASLHSEQSELKFVIAFQHFEAAAPVLYLFQTSTIRERKDAEGFRKTSDLPRNQPGGE